MTRFRSFDPVAPITEETIAAFAGAVPTEVAELWRTHGAGLVGDGYFRFLDPERAAKMLAGVFELPEGSTVLFATALGDLVVHVKGLYLVYKSRWGAIDLIEGLSFDELVALIEDPAQRDAAWEWQPYPTAAERDGVPGFEQCFGFVPLLALGGSPDPAKLQLAGLYEHLAVIAQLAGQPQVRAHLQTGDAQVTDTTTDAPGESPLVAVGRALFEKLTEDPKLNVIELPDGLGVCLVHAVRGGGKIYVAPDETVLFVGSAVDFDAGLGAFRDGVRTPPEKFDIDTNGQGA
ncbi:T6SS immunity protein Tdi1 domain-containing protein [Agromyces laixinhei]|uniref:T6SS immunity protein Tdi1 domain-containing protein n=1 Tax=Agromyces laixinhei TaxID=2585717 RepID=UPI00111739B9|nr:T6SS immunity protein Tdi1 domain-containing protein [Agromyces laixinhei]